MSRMSAFQQAKLFLVDTTGLDKDALHIHVSLILYLGSCLAFRWKARQWMPWLIVLLAALTGEALDIREQFAGPWPMQWAESAKDIVNTLIAPTMIMLAARLSPLFGASGHQPEMPGGAAGSEGNV